MPLTPAQQRAVDAKVRQIARRMLRDAERGSSARPVRRSSIPRRARPQVVLVVRRQPKAQDAASGTPGTLVADDGERAELYVGRRRWWSVAELSAVASQTRSSRTLTVVAHTQVAGEGARKALNQVWRLQDIEASGLVLPESVRRRLSGGRS